MFWTSATKNKYNLKSYSRNKYERIKLCGTAKEGRIMTKTLVNLVVKLFILKDFKTTIMMEFDQ